MPYYHRKKQRLANYDYSQQNFYYVTICTWDKRCLFGIGNQLTALGQIATSELEQLPMRYTDVIVDKYVVMPNHIHMIVEVGCAADAGKDMPSLSTIIGGYKSGVSRNIHEQLPNLRVWQKSFYDEIIRNDQHYQRVWNYIDGNPSKWTEDVYFTEP